VFINYKYYFGLGDIFKINNSCQVLDLSFFVVNISIINIALLYSHYSPIFLKHDQVCIIVSYSDDRKL